MADLKMAINEFNSANNLTDVARIYQKYESLNDINIDYFAALTKMKLGFKNESLQNLKNVASDIICNNEDGKYRYWDSASMHSIGDSLFLLLKHYYKDEIPFDKFTFSAFNLSYLCLSNNIYNFPETSCDSYFKRAVLLNSGSLGKGMLTMRLVQGSIGLLSVTAPLIINDFYSSGRIYISQYNMATQGQNLIERARRIHLELEDMTIDGRDASDYSIEEIAKIGRMRHRDIYSVLLNRYSKKDFFLTKEEFTQLCR
jgi:hypothetical protein